MNLADQLAQARADLDALNEDTGKLQENVRDQNADLAQVRRDARGGTATFSQVVQQQARAEAAAGMLAQHFQDVADQSALVKELEVAQAETNSIIAVREARAQVAALSAEYESVAAQAEAELAAAVRRLREIDLAYNAAQAVVKPQFARVAAERSGYSMQDVSDVLTNARSGPMGQPGADRRQAVNAAVQSFAEQIEPETSVELLDLVRRQFADGIDTLRLYPMGFPLLTGAFERARRT